MPILAVPVVVKLPPVMLPVAVINPAVVILPPAMLAVTVVLPVIAAVPVTANVPILAVPVVVKLPPVMLPVAEITPETYWPVVANSQTFAVPPTLAAILPLAVVTLTLDVPLEISVASMPVKSRPLPKK